MNNEQDLSKLPRWARSRIEKLEADIAYYKEQYLAISTGQSRLRCTDSISPPLGLPERNTIEADVLGGTLEITIRAGILELRSDSAVIIQSSAGNVLKAWVRK